MEYIYVPTSLSEKKLTLICGYNRTYIIFNLNNINVFLNPGSTHHRDDAIIIHVFSQTKSVDDEEFACLSEFIQLVLL